MSRNADSDPTQLAAQVRAGDRRALARAITLVESSRREDQAGANRVLEILTPHAGEFARLSEAKLPNATLVLKGPVTRIESRAGLRPAPEGRSETCPTYHSFFGGPVLARGGSGDLLAGLIGGLLAQMPVDPLLAAARGVVWHGLAADALARAHGQTAVQTTQLLDFLDVALRGLGAPKPGEGGSARIGCPASHEAGYRL